MNKYINRTLLLLSLSLFSGLATYAQPKSLFSKGKIWFTNSEIKTGYIWMATDDQGDKKVYFKESISEIPRQFTGYDIMSLTLQNGSERYVVESVSINGFMQLVFLKVHLSGEYDLLSYNRGRQNAFILIGPDENQIELINSPIHEGGKKNNYQYQFDKEYINQLKELFSDDPRLSVYIDLAEYNARSLTSILHKYHSRNKIIHSVYPPKLITGFFVSAGTSYSTLGHISMIDPSFFSKSALGNVTIKTGINLLQNKMDISLEANSSFGIIYHDNSLDRLGNTIYYEELINASLVSLGASITLKPFSIGPVSTAFSLGGTYNFFSSYKQNITEEILFNQYNIVTRAEFESVKKPEPFPGLKLGAGIEYSLNSFSQINLSYSFHKYFNADFGCQNAHCFGISYQRNVSGFIRFARD